MDPIRQRIIPTEAERKDAKKTFDDNKEAIQTKVTECMKGIDFTEGLTEDRLGKIESKLINSSPTLSEKIKVLNGVIDKLVTQNNTMEESSWGIVNFFRKILGMSDPQENLSRNIIMLTSSRNELQRDLIKSRNLKSGEEVKTQKEFTTVPYGGVAARELDELGKAKADFKAVADKYKGDYGINIEDFTERNFIDYDKELEEYMMNPNSSPLRGLFKDQREELQRSKELKLKVLDLQIGKETSIREEEPMIAEGRIQGRFEANKAGVATFIGLEKLNEDYIKAANEYANKYGDDVKKWTLEQYADNGHDLINATLEATEKGDKKTERKLTTRIVELDRCRALKEEIEDIKNRK